MTDPAELENQWYDALKAGRPDLTEEQLRIEAMKLAAQGISPITGTDVRKAAEEAFDLGYVDEGKLWLGWTVVQKKGLPVVKTWIAQFWNDPAYFRSATRAGIGVVAGLILSGKITLPDPFEGWAWSLASLWPVILALPAGQTNHTPAQVKAIAIDPTIAPVPKP